MRYSSFSVLIFPPVISRLAFFTALATSVKVRLYARRVFSSTAISISSSGNPCKFTFEIPSIPRRSSSICRAICFNDFKEMFSALIEKVITLFIISVLKTIGGSISVGKELMRLTAFFTSSSTISVLKSLKTSTVIFAEFSDEMEVTRSIPVTPRRLSSIFNTIPSSISSGDAPGYIN